jgi:hypothetical protein
LRCAGTAFFHFQSACPTARQPGTTAVRVRKKAGCGWQLAVLQTCARGGAQATVAVMAARAGGTADEGLTGLGLLDSGVFASHDRARRTGGPKSEESSVPLRALLPRCSRHFMMASRDPPAGGSLDGSCSRWPEGSVVCGRGGMFAPRPSRCLRAAFSARNRSFSARRCSSSVSPAVKFSLCSTSGSTMTLWSVRGRDR